MIHTRLIVAALALAALPAHPQGFLDRWSDKLIEKHGQDARKEYIQKLAGDRDPRQRAEAADWLATQREPEAVTALATALASDSDARVREAAASALWRGRDNAQAARPQLLAALDDTDPNVVAQAAGALQALGMKEAELAPARKRVLASGASERSRFLAARNLVGYESPGKLVEAMIVYLERNVQGYTGSLSDRNRNNVEMVEKALERLVKNSKDRALIPPLVAALADTRGGEIPLIRTLGLFDPKPDNWTQLLIGQLDAPQPRVRYAALGQLRYVKTEKEVTAWVPRVAAMLQDPDASVRSEALWALGSAAGLAAAHVDAVVAALGDTDKSVRQSAARALGEMGESTQAIPAASKARIATAARPALVAAAENDAQADVRDEAKGALRKLGGAGSTAVAAVATPAPSTPSSSTGNEAAGMEVLRSRKVSFDATSYFSALQKVDVELARAFLDAGMSASAPLLDHGPPIRVMFFASRGCSASQRPTKPETVALAKLLLERGADVNASDKNGNAALSEAASKGCDREVMGTLIKAGAKVNATNGAGLTPFEMGLYFAHDGLEELIAAGYRMPPDKVKALSEGYKDRPASLAMIRKATRK